MSIRLVRSTSPGRDSAAAGGTRSKGKGRSVGAPRAGDTNADPRDRIRHRAYELYVARGGRIGDALSDWLEAERELSRQRSEESENGQGAADQARGERLLATGEECE